MIDSSLPLVREVFEALMIDGEACAWAPDGFTWWAHRLPQKISVRDGRLDVTTDVLFAGELPAAVQTTLVGLMRHPPMSGFIVEDGILRLFSSVVVHEPHRHDLRTFTLAALLQTTYAELGVANLSAQTGLKPAYYGLRAEPDDMLRFVGTRVVPAGDAPSVWTDEVMTATDVLEERATSLTPLPNGLNARLPFGETAAALLQVRTNQAHPELGNGVFVRLFLPTAATPYPATREALALRMNDLEKADAGAFSSIGSWTLERPEPMTELPGVQPGPPRLAHVVFAPNLLGDDVRLAELVSEEAARAHWASHLFET